MTAAVIVVAVVLGAMAFIALVAFVNRHRSPTPSGRRATSGSDAGYIPWIGADSASSDCSPGDAGSCGDGGGGGGGD